MKKVSKLTGREYKLFDYVGAPDAERVIIAMGSGCDAIEETINYLNKQGRKAGPDQGSPVPSLLSVKHFAGRHPRHLQEDRRAGPHQGARLPGRASVRRMCAPRCWRPAATDIKVVGGRYGLGSKEFNPTMVKAVYDNLAGRAQEPLHRGHQRRRDRHLPASWASRSTRLPKAPCRCKFYGLGSDGTVGANKNSIKIIGDHTDMYAQGYFTYDSKKSGGITVSHLRFGKTPIQSTYLIDAADFVACHNPSLRHQVRHGFLPEGRRRVPAEQPLDR